VIFAIFSRAPATYLVSDGHGPVLSHRSAGTMNG
jgi:hypothetical protein